MSYITHADIEEGAAISCRQTNVLISHVSITLKLQQILRTQTRTDADTDTATASATET